MNNRIVNITQEKFNSIDFSTMHCIKRYTMTHHDKKILWMAKMPYIQRKDVADGLYYKDGYTVEVYSFRGKSAVICKELYRAQREILEESIKTRK